MSKTESIRARMEPDLKHHAEHIFQTLGLSATDAITLFYKQVTLHQGLPFEVKIPNNETLSAIESAQSEEKLTHWQSLDALKAAHS